MTKVFIGLNFSEEGLLSRKISGFRKRFDPKFNQHPFSHMSLMAPFEIQDSKINDLSETLKEELETFYYGMDEPPKLSFTGVDVHKQSKKSILFLNPYFDSNLLYCSELVKEMSKERMMNKSTYKENKKQFLPLGEFFDIELLDSVIENASVEFKTNSELPIIGISLYQKKHGVWFEKESLITFDEKKSAFGFLGEVAL